MKITALYAAVPGNDLGLVNIKKVLFGTLEELGIKPEEINLFFSDLPHFDGVKSDALTPVIQSIRAADGLILAATSHFSAPNSLLGKLFEHMALDVNKSAMEGKNCLVAMVSDGCGPLDALHQVNKSLDWLGAADAVRIGVDAGFALSVDKDPQKKEIIERQVEDFYRIVRQQRQFVSYGYAPGTPLPQASQINPTPLLSGEAAEKKAREIANQIKMDNFTPDQKQDIQEITQFFAQKINPNTIQESPQQPITPAEETPNRPPAGKNCKQLTASLPHYFQPQLSGGLNATFQLSISGTEGFEGHLTIDNMECDYIDGIYENADITIIATDDIWTNVITGKVTAQKAFMIGQLKVRGNFVLLTRFDQLFKTDKLVK